MYEHLKKSKDRAFQTKIDVLVKKSKEMFTHNHGRLHLRVAIKNV